MGYVADFITGRSIAEGDKAIGIVIIPRVRGWPNPVLAAAVDPTHPHERFSPLSLPLQGFINDWGYFEPSKKQLALDLLLEAVGYDSWSKLFDEAFNFKGDNPGFERNGRRMIAGIAAMHVGTYEAMQTLATYEGNRMSGAADAARIFIDAQKRFRINKDDAFFQHSIFAATPHDDEWTTIEGNVIDVPDCARGLSDSSEWQLDDIARRHLTKRYSEAYLGDGKELTKVFELVHSFQKLCMGMNYSGRYFGPGGFMRHDNFHEIVKLQLATLTSTLENSGARRQIGYEWREEEFLDEMEGVSEQIRQLHTVVENEISKARAYFGDADAEMNDEEDDATPTSSMS